MSSQMAPDPVETADLQAADYFPFASATVMEVQTPYGARLENAPMIKVTVWRLLNTIVVLGLGIYKAVAAYLGQQTAPTTLDWVIGVLWTVTGYWVSFLEDAQLGPRGRWFFTQDHSGAVLSILTMRTTLPSHPEEVNTASPFQVPRSTIVITHEDDRRDGFAASDQTGGGSAPGFSTANLAASALDLPGGSSEPAPLEIGDVAEARANVTEGSENLGRGEMHDDSGTFETTTSALLNNRGRRAMIACTNCRRRKIKCVTSEEPAQHPCARCTKKGLVCEYIAVDETTTPESPTQPLLLPPYYAAAPAAPYTTPGIPPAGYMSSYAPPQFQAQPAYPANPQSSNYNSARYALPQDNPSGGSLPLNPPHYGGYGTFYATTSATFASDSSGGAAQSLPFWRNIFERYTSWMTPHPGPGT
ncbi:C6 finger domain [Mycena sanguinolenta]|uniref:C6 finger domain n=1 Tax=Mycena sanguinolenta TaxID=230812 RepID=A0A8H6WQX1_9AGAR|nr:C6 finger domain [Mycena sanguinolenta]